MTANETLLDSCGTSIKSQGISLRYDAHDNTAIKYALFNCSKKELTLNYII